MSYYIVQLTERTVWSVSNAESTLGIFFDKTAQAYRIILRPEQQVACNAEVINNAKLG